MEADYVIAGCGAVGMAFADSILANSDASLIMIDRHAQPGGHWNVAYPFVTLHQPSLNYGVATVELSKGRIEKGGLNDTLNELATGDEVSVYFDDVMQHHFLPGGRVQYFPMCEYEGGGRFRSLLNDKVQEVTATKSFVDATYLTAPTPSSQKPEFSIGPEVRCIPINALSTINAPPKDYVVIGGGKTGIDACLWLLKHGVSPELIRWVVPRDAWLLDRQNVQPTKEFFTSAIGSQACLMESIANAEDLSEMFRNLESSGYLRRIYTDIEPTMFRGATVSTLELDELRRIEKVIRLGRVKSIDKTEIVLEQGVVPTDPNTLHINCSINSSQLGAIKPIFEDKLITPQMVRAYQPTFSASLVGYIEAKYDGIGEKNQKCMPVNLPNTLQDFIGFSLGSMMNQMQWSQDRELHTWIKQNRLDGFTHMMSGVDPADAEKIDILNRLRANTPLAFQKLLQFKARYT